MVKCALRLAKLFVFALGLVWVAQIFLHLSGLDEVATRGLVWAINGFAEIFFPRGSF